MSDDLVVRVARKICCPPHLGHCCPEECSAHYFLPTARAAIALALEEAVKLCEERITLLHRQFDVLDITRECDAYRIAADAIRAIIPKETNVETANTRND